MWTQIYSPVLDNVFLSALVAALPVVVLLGLLAFSRVKAPVAALLGLATALLVAIGIYKMPMNLAGMSAVHGALYGLLPIGWIVLNAIFIYDITVKSGDFEVLKHSIAGLAADRRIQALLIAFSFGAFSEGAVGFGTPVAISSAMLIGLGFRPLQAAGLALIGNTAPVAYGALGTPLIALAAVTELPLDSLSAAAGRILPIFSLIVPFWIVWVMAGRKAMLEVWPACLTSGASFAIVQFLVSNYHGPWLVDIAGAIISMICSVVLLKFWQPRTVWRYAHEQSTDDVPAIEQSRGAVLKAWLPWVLMSLFVFAWGIPQIKQTLNGGTKEQPNALSGITKIELPLPLLNKSVIRTMPVVPQPTPEEAVFKIEWLAATGTSLLLAGIVGGLVIGIGPVALLQLYFHTLYRVRTSLLTISAMLALGFTSKAAGLDATLGLAFASTGVLFPFF
ncbi:MAG TPA: lactate permease LctP family transporter, partial [Pirellulaceae bacterium]|nr:lactate permease LctP family transporter [Pirellulaceae bacterium]